MNNSLFTNNTAINQDGGALYLECEENANYKCEYNISNSIFINNTANINGGAIKYTFY